MDRNRTQRNGEINAWSNDRWCPKSFYPHRTLPYWLHILIATTIPHINDTKSLEGCLKSFHDHKDIVIELGVCDNFNIPKLHSILHYVDSIRSLGSADSYNLESPERLHIEFVKEAYHASNKQDYVEQMAIWLQRQEASWLRESYLIWVENRLESLIKAGEVKVMDEDKAEDYDDVEHDQVQLDVTQCDINITQTQACASNLNLPLQFQPLWQKWRAIIVEPLRYVFFFTLSFYLVII